MIKRFDLVRIKTTKNITFLSGPASRPANPNGIWVVYAGVDDDEIILTRKETIIRIPITDTIRVAEYGLEHAFESIKKIRTKADILKHPFSSLKELDHDKKEKGRNTG
jgi:hypothetical protein